MKAEGLIGQLTYSITAKGPLGIKESLATSSFCLPLGKYTAWFLGCCPFLSAALFIFHHFSITGDMCSCKEQNRSIDGRLFLDLKCSPFRALCFFLSGSFILWITTREVITPIRAFKPFVFRLFEAWRRQRTTGPGSLPAGHL